MRARGYRKATSADHYLRQRYRVADSGCWVYTGPTHYVSGYGETKYCEDGKLLERRAHRLAYRTWVGPIPEGRSVCHSCDNPACINPEHLWVGTHRHNMRDMALKGLHPKRRTVLAPEDQETLRMLKGHVPAVRLAEVFGLHWTAVFRIWRRDNANQGQ